MTSTNSQKLRAIVYVSTATIDFDTPALERLLRDAREFNQKNSITGILLFNDGKFMQYFEGTEPATQETWDRIRASKRHSGLVELFDATVDHRLFGAWEMGFARPTSSEMLELSNLKWKSMRSTSGAIYPRPDALVLLEQFWKLSQK